MAEAHNEGLQRLVKQAKSDPQFFHDLIWNTESALGSVGYLSRLEKAAILAIRPEDLVVGLASGLAGGTIAANCGGTCGASCGGSCGASCGGSCTVTCAASCPATGLMPAEGAEVINPAVQAAPAQQIASQVIQQLGARSFSQFRR